MKRWGLDRKEEKESKAWRVLDLGREGIGGSRQRAGSSRKRRDVMPTGGRRRCDGDFPSSLTAHKGKPGKDNKLVDSTFVVSCPARHDSLLVGDFSSIYC
jgi:hypothetical protein